jgi:hypothetical protein
MQQSRLWQHPGSSWLLQRQPTVLILPPQQRLSSKPPRAALNGCIMGRQPLAAAADWINLAAMAMRHACRA